MPLVNPTLPNDGEGADAVDIAGPFLELLAVFNGHIGADNIEPGTIPNAIGDGEVGTDMLAASAVTTNKLADGSVTPQKVAAAVSVTTHSSSTITPVGSTRMYIVTALDGNTTIAAPTGTPTDGQGLTLRIKDSGSARTLTWNAIYRAIGLTLPTSTVAGKEMYVSLVYNAAATKWDVVSLARQA
jgi:hypothetical protein